MFLEKSLGIPLGPGERVPAKVIIIIFAYLGWYYYRLVQMFGVSENGG